MATQDDRKDATPSEDSSAYEGDSHGPSDPASRK
ncbi:MAG: hypothetical protein K0Q43_3065 [Ramlibacter sp.]|nr:hypothetical protein [Ramlibacter sp.]